MATEELEKNIVVDALAGLTGSVTNIGDHSHVLADAGFSSKEYSFEDLTESSFPSRQKNRVTLYQDAHVGDEFWFTGRAHHNTYEDMFQLIAESSVFVFITGWSVDTTKALIRRPPGRYTKVPRCAVPPEVRTIGDLLKWKASQGVVVLIHIWDDPVSVTLAPGKFTSGAMNTADQQTEAFFQGTPVKVVKSLRLGDKKDSSLLWTHHQKTIIADALIDHAVNGTIGNDKIKKNKKEKKKKGKKENENEDSEAQQEIETQKTKKDKKEKKKPKKEDKKEKKKKEKGKEKKDEKKEKRKKGKNEKSRDINDPGDGDDDDESEEEEEEDDSEESEEEEGSRAISGKENETDVCRGLANGQRRIIAFVGGLDLTGGRWDNFQHSLYRTLSREHATDFYNGWNINADYGCRQPWHDIHSRIEGPAARDILSNFIQRWKTQAPISEKNSVDPIVKLISSSKFLSIKEEEIELGPETWTVRALRSITNYSANEVKGVENSIQQAYVEAIRKAKRFIYIENQYFMGSSPHWDGSKDVACRNLIPYEIANRIAESIKQNSPVFAYILIPLQPEGYPTAKAIQEQLKWQRKTFQMMYRIIADAIKTTSQNRHPAEFLSVFCLVNRETTIESAAKIQTPPLDRESKEYVLFNSRRFQIYIHSKFMIVDDEFGIVGSANINERSLAGDRDTEIAIEFYQDGYINTKTPYGEIHKFRRSLFAEHCGCDLVEFIHPNSFECAAKLHEIGNINWGKFTSPTIVEMGISHLCVYPYLISNEGVVTPKLEIFVDTKGLVFGSESIVMPDALTM